MSENPKKETFTEMVDLAKIHPSPTNPRKRFPQAKLFELRDSIKEQGVLQPILIRKWRGTPPRPETEYEVVAGERRYRGSLLAELEQIPAIIRNLTDQEVIELQMVENLQREDLTPIEEAEGLGRMLEMKDGQGNQVYTVALLADKLGKSDRHIYHTLALRVLPDAVKMRVEAGELPAKTARLLSRLPNEKVQEEAAEKILKPQFSATPLSFSEAEEMIKTQYTVEMTKPPFDVEDADLLPDAGVCSACPKLSKNLPGDEGKGQGKKLMCHDPACFAMKKELHWQKEAASTIPGTLGAKVLSLQESEKLFGVAGLQYSAPYVLAKSSPDEALLKSGVVENKTWATLVKGRGVESVLARDQNGKARELLPKKPAIEAAGQNGHDIFPEKNVSGSRSEGLGGRQQGAGEEEALRRQAIEERLKVGYLLKAAVTIASEIVKKVERDIMTDRQWRMVALLLFDTTRQASHEWTKEVLALVGVSDSSVDSWKEALAARSEVELAAPFAVLALISADPLHPQNGGSWEGYGEESCFFELAEVFGHDAKAVEKEALAAAEEEIRLKWEQEDREPLAA